MKLVESKDILGDSHRLNRLTDSVVSKLVMYILRLNKLDKLYAKVYDADPEARMRICRKYRLRGLLSRYPIIRSGDWTALS